MNALHSGLGPPPARSAKWERRPIVAAVLGLIVVIWAAGSVSVRGEDANPPPAPPRVELRPEVSPTESKLRARTDLTVVNVPRQLAVKKLSEWHGIVIKLDEKALAAAGVVHDAPVTTSIRNYTLRAALFHVLGNADLHFEVHGDVLAVTVVPPQEPAPPAPAVRRAALAPVMAVPQPAFEFRVGMMQNGLAALAQINGVRILCAPPQDAAAGANPPVDPEAPPRKLQITMLSKGTVEKMIFDQDQNAAGAHDRLLRRLDEKIDSLDRLYGLNDRQRERLRLAGRGDVKHVLDRAAAIQARFANVAGIGDLNEFERWAKDLSAETEAVRADLSSGPFDDNSLFVKALKRTLTPEQPRKSPVPR